MPIRKELVVQLIRSFGIRKIKGWKIYEKLTGPARTSLSRPTENNVFFGPGMHRAAVRTGKFLRFHFGGFPVLVVDRAAGVG